VLICTCRISKAGHLHGHHAMVTCLVLVDLFWGLSSRMACTWCPISSSHVSVSRSVVAADVKFGN
jgi:hypothetical protein